MKWYISTIAAMVLLLVAPMVKGQQYEYVNTTINENGNTTIGSEIVDTHTYVNMNTTAVDAILATLTSDQIERLDWIAFWTEGGDDCYHNRIIYVYQPYNKSIDTDPCGAGLNNTANCNISGSYNESGDISFDSSDYIDHTWGGSETWQYSSGRNGYDVFRDFYTENKNTSLDSFSFAFAIGSCDGQTRTFVDYTNMSYAPFLMLQYDITPPDIELASPQNTSYIITTINLSVAADEPISTWWYSLNSGTNMTFSPNTTITAAQGINHIIVWANDTHSNLNSAEVYFYVDTLLPSVEIASPENIRVYNETEIDLNVSGYDASGLDIWFYSLDNAANVTFTPNTTITVPASALVHNITICVNDTIGLWGCSTNFFGYGEITVQQIIQQQTNVGAGVFLIVAAFIFALANAIMKGLKS